MTESFRLPESEGQPTPQVAGRPDDLRSNLSFVADISQKLAIPLLTVAATGLGIYLSYNANERARLSREREQEIAAENNRLSLTNQREQSETSLRSTMFRELVGPLLSGGVGGKEDPRQAAQQLALLAELLTLNFHEHFELGPALRYVDRLPSQTEDARLRLRSTARRVISRQLAPMIVAGQGSQGNGNPAYIEIKLTGKAEGVAAGASKAAPGQPAAALPACRTVGTPDVTTGLVEMTCANRPPSGDGAQVPTVPLIVTSPDGKDSVKITLSSFDWADQTVAVFAELQPPAETAAAPGRKNFPLQRVEFTLSSYSLPFSDNTLLPSGNRFGMYIRTVDEIPGFGGLMTVWFVWFPKDFVPPRERPFDLDFRNSGSQAPGEQVQRRRAAGGLSAPGAAGT